ncbi:MAG: TatD family hydrolase [Desulfobulbaceae bacterium]|jgi:TatD DNase family protein|nr:TatD family hydrolase [Desulfobulbaceae bacterium]
MELFDTHCHLDIDECFPDWAEQLARARAVGLSAMLLPGVTRRGWPGMLTMARQHQGLYAAPGLHPMYLARHSEADLAALDAIATEPQVLAIGEIGLDYYHANADRQAQQRLFEAQLLIARRHELPILLHVRKAHDQVLATLRRKHFPFGGIVHAYNGSLQQAEAFIKLGFLIAVGGAVTWERSRKIRATAQALPLDCLTLETDAPDIPIAGQTGKRNLPEHILAICQALAVLRGEAPAELARQTTANARRLLRLD